MVNSMCVAAVCGKQANNADKQVEATKKAERWMDGQGSEGEAWSYARACMWYGDEKVVCADERGEGSCVCRRRGLPQGYGH